MIFRLTRTTAPNRPSTIVNSNRRSPIDPGNRQSHLVNPKLTIIEVIFAATTLYEVQRRMRVASAAIAVVLVCGLTVSATDFLTEGFDSARTGWVRDEKVFTPANVGTTTLLWKLKLESTPRAMHNLFAPLVAERVDTPQGP